MGKKKTILDYLDYAVLLGVVAWLACAVIIGIHRKEIWSGLCLGLSLVATYWNLASSATTGLRFKFWFLAVLALSLYLLAGFGANWDLVWLWCVPPAEVVIMIVSSIIADKVPKTVGSYKPSTSYQGTPSIKGTPSIMGMPVVDLRSADEQMMERQAGSALSGEDEEIAQRLAQLSKISNVQYSSDKAAYEKTVAEFQSIGEKLCANGGDARMKRVAYRVQALGGRVRDCEMYWNGICGWMA